jgi:hypothetical protein
MAVCISRSRAPRRQGGHREMIRQIQHPSHLPIEKQEFRRIWNDIRQVLLTHGDPVSVKDEPMAQDDYDVYIGPLFTEERQGRRTKFVSLESRKESGFIPTREQPKRRSKPSCRSCCGTKLTLLGRANRMGRLPKQGRKVGCPVEKPEHGVEYRKCDDRSRRNWNGQCRRARKANYRRAAWRG